MTDFTRTREALRVYDEGKPEREKLWDAAAVSMNKTSYVIAEASDTAAVEQVILAFFEDTKHINSLDRCKLIHPNDPWLRRLVAKES
jgi:hypothetical protein